VLRFSDRAHSAIWCDRWSQSKQVRLSLRLNKMGGNEVQEMYREECGRRTKGSPSLHRERFVSCQPPAMRAQPPSAHGTTRGPQDNTSYNGLAHKSCPADGHLSLSRR